MFKRGYRLEQSVAPLNEVLAAGILLLSRWKASASLTDPMCGSGTILLRRTYSLQNTPGNSDILWISAMERF